jgi:hypothetical protein
MSPAWKGATIAFTVPYPGRSFGGTIARIAHAVDIKTDMAVELDVMNADDSLAQYLCRVRWPIHKPGNALHAGASVAAKPTGSSSASGMGRRVVDVKTGLASGPLTEVFDVSPSDDLGARHGRIKPGTPVQVKEAKPATS